MFVFFFVVNRVDLRIKRFSNIIDQTYVFIESLLRFIFWCYSLIWIILQNDLFRLSSNVLQQ
jgi:hypothetical protein